MSWIVNWQGKEYDVDPMTFSGLELTLIKQRTAFTFRKLISEGIPDMDGDAIRVLFWVVDRRTDPNLNFTDYPGPPLEVVLPALPGFIASASALADDLGKAMGTPKIQTTEMNGSDGSPSFTPPSETETFMIDLSNVTGTG